MNLNLPEIQYKVKAASLEDLVDHLRKCDDSFTPPLHTYVNIEEYSNKIFKSAVTFEAWINHDLVGLIAVYYNNATARIGFVTNVSVISLFQGKGIASKILKNVVEYGKANSFKKLMLEVRTQNLSAIAMYEKYGFTVIGNKEDKFIMEYLLIETNGK